MIRRKEKRGSKVQDNNNTEPAANQETETEVISNVEVEPAEVELSPTEKLEKQCSDYLNLHQRTLAEFDNFRKRTSKEKASMFDDGVRSTAEKLLPIIDNLERAVAAQENSGTEGDSFFKGVQMTLVQFQEVLKDIGVTEISAIGEKFNPKVHAAVAHEDNAEYGENEVVLVMLKGYQYKDKVIRASMVKVAN